ncbi:hypothetical protein TRFO_06953 [Tritrichomonas foetus]|uniref:TFIID subunit TAF5 NTD2 domain-containing protein n=1 Tax=Tritrichomonas foetus TaxID=1144522 RepID=A0A1J4JUS6_9EUKA|nr:hypothetical protein TRFO_06953 [Tritrichomonas foetus]|eukprot:OHT02897.1 hypothetical protein TRFO_06953 [Tritrichomonas foetus]
MRNNAIFGNSNNKSGQQSSINQISKIPPFVMEFLVKNNLKTIPSVRKTPNLQNADKGGPLYKAIDSILQCRSPRAIQKTYELFRKIVHNSPPFLQEEYSQLLFPYFIILVVQLHELNYLTEFKNFIDRYRGDFPKDYQSIIDQVRNHFDTYQIPQFEVDMSQFAIHDLTQKFKKYDSVLLPYVFENCISINFVPFRAIHKLSYDQIDTENIRNEIDQTNFDSNYEINLNPAIYNGDLNTSAKISTEEITEQDEIVTELPNIAHFTLYNHKDSINDIKLSKSAELLAYTQNSRVCLNILSMNSAFPTGNNQEYILKHRNRITTLEFSSNSCLIASASVDGEIRVAHTEACRELCHYDYHMKPVYALSFDKNSFLLSAASHDRTISMWALNHVGMVRQFIGHKQPVVNVLFESSGNKLISSSTDSRIRIWDIGAAKMIDQFEMKNEIPTAMAVHPNHMKIACGSVNGTVILYDADEKTRIELVEASQRTQITDLKFSNDGNWLFAGTTSGKLHAWEISEFTYDSINADASTIDTICITKDDLVVTLGQSLRVAIHEE